jgi:hypothetical protein
MNYVVQGAAHRIEPPSERLLKPSEAIGVRPEARMPSSSTRARRSVTSRIVAAWSSRRRVDGLPDSGSRQSTESGVSPLASGASRGIALFISR